MCKTRVEAVDNSPLRLNLWLPKDTLQLAIDTAQKAAAPTRIETGDPRLVTMLHGDKKTEILIPPPVRQSLVRSLEDLMNAVDAAMTINAVLWHDDPGDYETAQVVLVLDNTDRRDTVRFPLKWSREFLTLRNLDARPELMNQRSFIRLLRQTLGVDEARVGFFRRLAWVTGAEAEADLLHLLLNVPVYEDLGERDPVQVRCHVEIDLAGQQLALVPFAGEIRHAIDVAQLAIHSRLVERLGKDVPVYYGRP